MIPIGEANITKGAGLSNIIQMVSSNASLSYSQIAEARVSPSQPLFFQLYKHKDNKTAEARVREVVELGYNAIFLTVDAIVPGNRERDVRAGWEQEDVEQIAEEGGSKSKSDLPRKRDDMKELEMDVDVRGTAGALIANDDLNMTWKKVRVLAFTHLPRYSLTLERVQTIPWLRSITKLPIVIKGIQCVEASPDAILEMASLTGLAGRAAGSGSWL